MNTCENCARRFKTYAALELHQREKKHYGKENANAGKHRRLCYAVVQEALAYWHHDQKHNVGSDVVGGAEIWERLSCACAELEKFETGGKKQ
jgi:hypothetical protein